MKPAPGEGEGGHLGGPSGDLYIYITVKPHKIFKRREDDIRGDFSIDFVQAALGAEVQVPTIAWAKLTIPGGHAKRHDLRLRGKGFSKLRGYGRGDQHVKVNVLTPTRLSDEQKQLLRKFSESFGKGEDKKGFFEKVFGKDD